MHKSLTLSSLALIFFCFTGCNSNPEKRTPIESNNAPYTIKLNESEDNKGEVLLSDFAQSITYLGLESSEEHLIAGNSQFYLADEHILSTAFRQIYVFDKTDGKFVREVSSFGEGPDQYTSTTPQVHINEVEQAVYVRNQRGTRVGLDISGNEKLKFKTPAEDSTFTGNFLPIKPGLFVGFHSNYDCKQSLKLILFDEAGKVIKTHQNGIPCINEHPDRISFNSRESSFYNWSDEVFFKEQFNDTVYQVSEESLSFYAVFENGDKALPYAKKTSLITSEDMAPYFRIDKLDETEDFIFFSLNHKGDTHSAYYNKSKNETRVAYNENSELHYFTNDLDGFIPFSPSYATADGKLVGYLEAPYVLEWFEMNPEKAAKLPPALKQFENMDEDDNPIVMIVNTKD